ncbi:MAG: NAD(P)-dependent oxidoreductase [Euryarchaeota archaeon]|nr:NAD(P)-dependent oxidoreductase [Euryarchaeota archaeon]
MKEIKNVLVTGAGGTVGNYVAQELLSKGYNVTVSDLKDKFMKEWLNIWYECRRKGGGILCTFPCDLRNRNLVVELIHVGDFDAVIHCAALIDISAPKDILYAVNYEATHYLYEVAHNYGVKVFVFLSSGAIYDDKGILTETSRVRASNEYEKSKIMAEKYLKSNSVRSSSPKVIILRPSLIYGPKNKFLGANYLAIAIVLGENLGKALPHLLGGPRTNFVHSKDVARATVFLMEYDKKPLIESGEIFNISDNSPMGFGDQLHAIAKACGYKGNLLPLPLPPAFLINLVHLVYESPIFLKGSNAVLSHYWKKLVKKYNLVEGFKPEITREMTPFFGKNSEFSNEELHYLGFRLKYPLFKYGIRDAIAWLREARWIP